MAKFYDIVSGDLVVNYMVEDSGFYNVRDDMLDKIDQQRPISIKELYPEFEFKFPYTYLPKGMKLYNLLPFFEKIIIDIHPYSNEKLFIKDYGIDPIQLAELFEEKRVLVRYEGSLSQYQDLKYIKPVFKLMPPSENRYYRILVENFPDLYENSFEKFKDIFKKNGYFSINRGPNNNTTDLNIQTEFNTYIDIYINLCCVIGKEMADSLVDLAYIFDFGTFNWIYFTYAKFLVYPHILALDGIYLSNFKDIADARSLKINKKSSILPFDVGRQIMDMFQLRMPDELDIALEIKPTKWFSALAELNNAILKDNCDDVYTQTQTLKNEITSINQAISDLSRKRNLALKSIQNISLTMGIIGPFAAQLCGNGVIDTISILLGLASVNKFIEPAIDTLLKFEKSSNICMLYDINKQIDLGRAKKEIKKYKFWPF